jgi:tetratricopeptide (TPR) repeat protein
MATTRRELQRVLMTLVIVATPARAMTPANAATPTRLITLAWIATPARRMPLEIAATQAMTLVPSTRAAGATHAAPEPDAAIERVDALIREHEQTDKIEPLQAAASMLDELVKAAPNDYAASWRRARAYQMLGELASKDSEKLDLFQRAIDSGKAAVKSKPNAVEGHYWLGVSYGVYGETKGMFKALSMIDDIRAEMNAAIKIDPKYDDAGAYLVLGRIDFELPGLFGGNSKRAIEEYEQGLKLAPSNALMKLYLSDSYYDAGRKDDAKRLLEELIALKVDEHSQRGLRQTQRDAKASYEKHFAKKEQRHTDG